jgi:hypothetical protein
MKLLDLYCAVACATFAATPALAQETDISGRISVELNAVETTDTACILTFMIINGLEVTIDRVVYETVLFDTGGQVNRLTLFDFGMLPPVRPRVRQFAVPNLSCDRLGRILFNGANACEGAGLDDGVCDSGLMPSTRTDVEVLG